MSKVAIITTLTLLCAAAAFAQQKGTFTDSRDKKAYKTVKIGEQTWMAENLNYTTTSGSKCYENKPANCTKYGRIYNFATAMNACPKGWYLPTSKEWDALADFAGGNGDDKDETAEKKLKAKNGWGKYYYENNEKSGNGTDNYGFSALPGGRGSSSGDFALAGGGGRWWSASGDYRRINSDYQGIPWRSTDGSFLFSVRCLKGEPAEQEKTRAAELATFLAEQEAAEKEAAKQEAAEKAAIENAAGKQFNSDIKYGSITDARDKTTYRTTKIGELTWMAENLKYNTKDSKCYNNKEHFCKRDGRLYDWTAANKVCPAGWHLPNQKEWDILVSAIGGYGAEKKLKTKSGWESNENGTDDYGFSALPTGNGQSTFWNATADTANNKYSYYDMRYFRSVYSRMEQHSVRCVQGKSSEEAIAIIEKAAAEKEAAEKAAVEKAAGKQFNPKIKYGSMTDARDKITYKTVKIGNQTWMAENLNYNADGSKCYKDKEQYCKRDGRLYNRAVALKACPVGWHLPTDGEWEALDNFAGGWNPATASKLKAASGWLDSAKTKPLNGTDDFGFSALPIGNDNEALWWSASAAQASTVNGIHRKINNSGNYIRSSSSNGLLYSIRCVEGGASNAAPAAQPASQPKQPPAEEFCTITFPKKACIKMPGGTCKMSGGKVVGKCP